jgi:hypothetical protein
MPHRARPMNQRARRRPCKRARADQSAISTALWLDRLGFIRLRRRQRLRRCALDLLPAPRVDDDAAENYFGAAATVRIGRCGELMRHSLPPGSVVVAADQPLRRLGLVAPPVAIFADIVELSAEIFACVIEPSAE